MLLTWELLAVRHDRHHLIVELEASDGTKKTAYLASGLLASLGRESAPLYDGKAAKR